ncbi:glycerophosphodiester phosphodiesterase GDPDL7-like [Oryza brachyantha]|uniref:glycerophosphodiester phosphodiesterase GDPDL7-like n=1 Tax=Oryza brachyantha TaxID=4533 RepID=UPI001ADB6EBC|nr:glycerophosphodiester phosphodiesterase GDPDL7-like [Oryza brachyantha]
MAAKWAQKTVVIPAQRRGCHLVTPKILREIEGDLSGFKCGLAHLFLQHTSASLTINENYDSDVQADTETFLNRIVPEGRSAPWKHTLEGQPPLVIARGGFSGLFPESSQFSYQFAMSSSLHDVVLYCDLQLSSDGLGFCKTGLTLENSTLIAEVFPNRAKKYKVNGEEIHGWFSLDFTSDELYQNVTLIQDIFSRPSTFDGAMGMFALEDLVGLRPPHIWVNVEYGLFLQEHKLSPEDYILGLPKDFSIAYISSPEIAFLKNLGGKLKKGNTKLIFRFLSEDEAEPTTKKTYGEMLKDLKSVKAFATGILVPKEYIWPLSKDQYLQLPTSLVKDAHALGLEVFASGFANDVSMSYNYSYDPSAEYLQFIDNPEFSVDGLITDFPPTASGAVACLAHTKGNPLPPPGGDGGRPLIITHNGASGVYPGSTDLAYQQAVKDGADIIDCAVRMSKDGVAFCLASADLSTSTTASASFMTKISTVSEIQNKSGIFSFDLTWSEIQTLKPDLLGPYTQAGLKRNPKAKNAGKFVTFPEFLELAKATNVSGILIEMEHTSYLAKRGLGLVEAVTVALANASYGKEGAKLPQVMIQSDDTSVLAEFKKFPAFLRVLVVGETISDASGPSVEEIREFAGAVTVGRSSIAQVNGFFLTRFTDVAERMHAANLTVHVGVLRNEFMNLGFDYWADPTVEIATYTSSVMADALVTEFPATAAAYFRSPCSDLSKNLSYTILPANAGALVHLAAPGALPPALPPAPVLEPADVLDPPLPPASATASAPGAEPSPGGGEDASGTIDAMEVRSGSPAASFLAKVALAVGVAATATVVSLFIMKQPSSSGPSFSLPQIVDASAAPDAAATMGYTFSLFGKKVIIPEFTPGWVYFWLLMAAGFGLFISEEALNVWVGISLARSLCLDGTWPSLVNSFSTNASYIISTVLWVYWGVCISDMVPFYLGKLFRQTKASEDISSKIGIGKEKALSISRAVQKYGNLIGFVERFSVGVRNPTGFLAGALGIPADCYFAGVCCGCLFTLPIQLAVGFFLRERPVVALASVAAAVGMWTVFPYAAAACTALFFYLSRRKSSE